jgi:23S rRNA (adenine-N6)-dimethyltransferase
VVAGDLRRVPLPRRPYHVVANVPFSTSSHLLRRLLGDPTSQLAGGELLVEWGFARRVTEPRAPGREVERWQRDFNLVLVARVPARCFSPVPAVNAAHLSITRR